MAFEIGVIRRDHYMELQVSGPSTIGHFVEMIDAVENESLFWSEPRVLVDLLAVEGQLTQAEQIFLGELVGQRLGHMERMASLVPSDQVTRNSETAAQKMGVQLRIFHTREAAHDWLTAKLTA